MAEHQYDYARKLNAAGDYATASEGDPSLISLILAAFPARPWVVRQGGVTLSVVFTTDPALTAQEETDLGDAYTAWDPDDLAAYKTQLQAGVDTECERRMEEVNTFEYPAASGNLFGTGELTQWYLTALMNANALGLIDFVMGPNPHIWTLDNSVDYTIPTAAGLDALYTAYYTAFQAAMDAAFTVKTNIAGAVDAATALGFYNAYLAS